MELLYIWIEDYKNIHHQGFNFSPQYRFSFEPEMENNEIKGGFLKNEIGENQKLLHKFTDFFLPSESSVNSGKQAGNLGKISNITAVVGENGAGKSNLLEFIKVFLNNRILIKESVLMIYKKNNRIFYYFSIESVEIALKDGLVISRRPETIDPTVIYYSNMLDFQRNDFSREKLISISMSSHFSDDSKTVWDIYIEDLKYKLEFIQNKENFWVPFHIQDCISIRILAINKFILEVKSRKYNETERRIMLLLRDLSFALITPSERNRSVLFLNQLKFKHLVRLAEYVVEKLQKDEEKGFFLEVCQEYFVKNYEASFKNFAVFLAMVSGNVLASSAVKSLNTEFENLLKPISGILDSRNDLIIIPDGNGGILIEQDFSMNQFMEIFKKYEGINYKYFDISFPGLSSGEESFLNLFSRIHSSRKKVEEMEKPSSSDVNSLSCNDILILIDEGEIGFHPEWQKAYLKNLVDFFPQNYLNRNIQIIITSHSPFLVSDLPKENIIFLRKGRKGINNKNDQLEELTGEFIDGTEKEGRCIVVDGLKNSKTFGANIHTLLADSFFLDSGLLGDFAYSKVIELMGGINRISKSTSIKSIQKYEAMIDIIGEPILEKKLKMLLEKKLNERKPKEFIRSRLERQKEEIDLKLRELDND